MKGTYVLPFTKEQLIVECIKIDGPDTLVMQKKYGMRLNL